MNVCVCVYQLYVCIHGTRRVECPSYVAFYCLFVSITFFSLLFILVRFQDIFHLFKHIYFTKKSLWKFWREYLHFYNIFFISNFFLNFLFINFFQKRTFFIHSEETIQTDIYTNIYYVFYLDVFFLPHSSLYTNNNHTNNWVVLFLFFTDFFDFYTFAIVFPSISCSRWISDNDFH